MSEVDRLSNSGLYPALPIADQRSRKEGGSEQPPPGHARPPPGNAKTPTAPGGADARSDTRPRPPKSIIDDYA